MNTIIECLFDFYSKPENVKAYEEWCKEQDLNEENQKDES
jgi:hypothetical protein